MKSKFMMVAVMAAAFLLGGCGTPSVETIDTHKTKAPLVFTTSARVDALFSLPVVPQVSGTLLAPLPDIGTELHAGDTIANLDTSVYDAQIADAESRLSTVTVSAPEPVSDSSMEASLLSQGIITRAEYDKLRGKKSVRTVSSGNEAMEAALASAKNARAACHITAPIDGIVAKIYNEKPVAQAGQPLLLIRQDSPVFAEIEIPAQMAKILDEAKVNRTLTVMISDAKLSRTWFGELKKETEEEGAPFAIYRVQADNPDRKLTIGETYTLRIDTGHETEGMMIPAKALMEGNRVQIVTDDGLLDVRSVTVGGESDGNIMIIAGLSEGEHVVVNPDERRQVGTKVDRRNHG